MLDTQGTLRIDVPCPPCLDTHDVRRVNETPEPTGVRAFAGDPLMYSLPVAAPHRSR